jgi:transcriptional regulator with XRE-family HTH domain
MYDVKLVAITQNMRRETGWSIRKIASIMNVSKSTTARWLQGSTNEKKRPARSLSLRGRPKIEVEVTVFPRFQYSSLRTIVAEATLNCHN